MHTHMPQVSDLYRHTKSDAYYRIACIGIDAQHDEMCVHYHPVGKPLVIFTRRLGNFLGFDSNTHEPRFHHVTGSSAS